MIKYVDNAVWYSPYIPTPEQLDGLAYNVVDIDAGIVLARIPLTNYELVTKVLTDIQDLVIKNEAKALVGIFPPPVQEVLISTIELKEEGVRTIPVYSSWGYREADAEYVHYSWCYVGEFPDTYLLKIIREL